MSINYSGAGAALKPKTETVNLEPVLTGLTEIKTAIANIEGADLAPVLEAISTAGSSTTTAVRQDLAELTAKVDAHSGNFDQFVQGILG